ncbi:MAG: 16S rRNA (adenine(1518)-N(6)/adenine(1519)-N(6))-dimethyltransferase RsmA [Bacteroidota bacterium]
MEDLTSPRVLREILSRYGLAPRKSLGQNFLIDANLRDKIVSAADPGPGELVVEVGPGPGTLTAKLLETGATVIAIEADRGLARILADRTAHEPNRMTVIVDDILRVDLGKSIAEAGLAERPCVAVANLPYYITTPAIFHLLETKLPWRGMVFLVQREVADRIVAAPRHKDYGLLSVMTQYRAVPEIVTILPPSVFWPQPKVQSALLRLTFPSRFHLEARVETVLAGVARAAFGQRRKTLANACRRWAEDHGLRDAFMDVCRQAGIEPGCRGEDLAVGDFVRLAAAIADRLEVRSPESGSIQKG